jgi:peptidase A4-like protein
MAALPSGAASAVTAAPRHQGLIAPVNTHQSSNWFGYNKALLPKAQLFKSISGDWDVPVATQHTPGESENSSVWLGIGGGCFESTCLQSDPTLIQTGTEEDVDASGNATYDAWYELIPAPELKITTMTVHPGDHMHAELTKADGDVWHIRLVDQSTGQQFSKVVPYPSTSDTAEWIAETPLLITGATFAALPNLSTVHFTNLKLNGKNPNLAANDRIQLINANGSVYGTPGLPLSGGTAFNDCAWASTC